MKKAKMFQLTLPEVKKALKVPAGARRVPSLKPARPTIEAEAVYKALTATAGAKEIIQRVPHLGDLTFWFPIATFSVCQKTGTALFLDIWDADHFDFFTDMQRCLTDCRAWFSADGFTFWGAPETKTGRINCFFNAPSSGTYICNAELQSFGGFAQVECLIDNSSFGPLPFNGSIIQPHPCNLVAGGHSFRIRQMIGSFFFTGLSVWKV
jgi:hypothetical protein